ncbi:MAG: archaellin/type IV pilin N-terminal domain-containing protein [Thermoplasmata archaeon]|jgi:flagellin-like protein
MGSRFPRRRRPHRGVANIIATILLVAITIVAGVFLWTFKFNTPAPAPIISFSIRSGSSNPVWGDPTDCLPWFPAWLGYNTAVSTSTTNITDDYYENGGNYAIAGTFTAGPVVAENGKHYGNNFTAWWNGGLANVTGGVKGSTVHDTECNGTPPTGDFSQMNSTQFIIAAHSPSVIPLSDIELIFECNNTVFVNGTLDTMTWFPGSSSGPAPDAPHLNKCGSFVPSGSYSTLYNRFGIFVPINQNATSYLEDGDTFIMYVHTSSPFDPDVAGGNDGAHGDCGPGPDCDDYHGAPAWCFQIPDACTLSFVYEGQPNSLLWSISLYDIIRG